MTNISSENPPDSLDDEVVEYLVRMFRQVGIGLSNSSILPTRLDITDPPKEGRLYYFKSIPPSEAAITSAGYWGFVGDPGVGTWVKLG